MLNSAVCVCCFFFVFNHSQLVSSLLKPWLQLPYKIELKNLSFKRLSLLLFFFSFFLDITATTKKY